MKKISILLVILLFTSIVTLSADTIGAIANSDEVVNATYSLGKLEFEVGLTPLADAVVAISTDYNILGSGFSIGSVSGFFWNGALGASTSISESGVTLGVISPWEFGFSFPVIETGIDLYLQVTPGYLILMDPGFTFNVGLGVRLGL